MKMGAALFWGLLLIIIGLSLIFRIVFNIDFPLLKIIVAFALIFLGIKLLFGSFGSPGHHHWNTSETDVIFGEKHYDDFGDHRDYNVIFGKGDYDFRDLDLAGEVKRVKISTVFGGSEIRLNRNMPVRIRVESAFAGADLPNGNSAVFGTTTWESDSYDPDKPYLDLKIDVVFGGAEVKLY